MHMSVVQVKVSVDSSIGEVEYNGITFTKNEGP